MTDWWGYDQRSQQSGWYSGDDQQQPVYPNLDSQGSYGYDQNQYAPSNNAAPAASYGVYDSAPQTGQNYYYGGNVFIPKYDANGATGKKGEDYENEPPLLEELGINFDHIKQKTLAVLNPFRSADASVIHDNDLAGPLVFCLLFGVALLLHGKIHFGYIYGIGVLGCFGIFGLLNLMSMDGISLLCTISVLGYCLLPMAILTIFAAVLSLNGPIGLMICGSAVMWCSVSASKLFVTALAMDHQQLLVAYPCSLLYGVFGLLAVF